MISTHSPAPLSILGGREGERERGREGEREVCEFYTVLKVKEEGGREGLYSITD